MGFVGRRTTLISLVVLTLVVCLTVGAAIWRGYRLDIFNSSTTVTGNAPVLLTVGGETLSIPANRLRFADQRRAGAFSRIELELKWPGLRTLADNDPALSTTARDGRLVFLTIEPRDTDLDTADRIATIYQKFLAPDQLAGPGGLIRRNFLAGTAYDGEELYFEPGSVHPFAARCFAIDKGQPPIICLRDVRLGKHLLATIRFPYGALGDWRALRDRTDTILAEMSGDTGG